MATQRKLHVLVTGGSGFVGRAVLDALLRRGHAVTATTHVEGDGLSAEPRVRWVVWNALDSHLPDVRWDDFQAVLHLAAPMAPFDFPDGAREMYALAVASTFRLLEMARQRGIARVVIASTGDVIGPSNAPAREDGFEYRPSSFYGAAKSCGELLLRAYEPLLSVAVVRFFHPYGPRGDRFLVNRLVLRVLEGNEVWYEGEEGISLNPVWVDDLAEGVVRALESGEKGVFHLAGPDAVSLRGLIALIGEVCGRPPVVRQVPGEVSSNHVGLFERSRMLLGFRPQVSLREGLRRLVELYT